MKKNKLATILTIAIVSVLALTGCGSAETREDDLKAAADKIIEAQEADNKKAEASKEDKKADAKESEKKDSKTEEKSEEKKAEAKTEDKKESAKAETKADTTSKDNTPSASTASKPSTASTPASAKPSTPTASTTPAPAATASKAEAPKGCTHTWKDNYQTVTVKAAWDEQVLVSAAWDETVVDVPERTEYTSYAVCHGCGYIPVSDDDAANHLLEALVAGRNCGPWGTKTNTITIPAVTHVEHHDAVYQTVHHDAVTEQQKVSTTCTKCGATK